VAADLRACPLRGQGVLGESTSLVDRVAGESHLPLEHSRLGGETGLWLGREQVIGQAYVPSRGRPPRPVHRRMG
jgi:hypothetical protein